VTTQCLGRFISTDPIEALFFSIQGEKVRFLTDLKIAELKKAIQDAPDPRDYDLGGFLDRFDVELEKKFAFDESSRHLKENIKAPITFAYYDIVEQKEA